jgi:hypothetical protein
MGALAGDRGRQFENRDRSMLGIDLADPPAVKPAGEIVPGKASWSWPLLGDQRTVFDTQKEFVDYAADMGWRYTLVDGLWDTQIGPAVRSCRLRETRTWDPVW